jgi:hypothetical protein
LHNYPTANNTQQKLINWGLLNRWTSIHLFILDKCELALCLEKFSVASAWMCRKTSCEASVLVELDWWRSFFTTYEPKSTSTYAKECIVDSVDQLRSCDEQKTRSSLNSFSYLYGMETNPSDPQYRFVFVQFIADVCLTCAMHLLFANYHSHQR